MPIPSGASRASAIPDATPTPTPRSVTGRLWADVPVDEVPDYNAPLVWDDDQEEVALPL